MKRIVNRRRNRQVNSFFRNPRSTPYKEPSSAAVPCNSGNKASVGNCEDVQAHNNHMTKEK